VAEADAEDAGLPDATILALGEDFGDDLGVDFGEVFGLADPEASSWADSEADGFGLIKIILTPLSSGSGEIKFGLANKLVITIAITNNTIMTAPITTNLLLLELCVIFTPSIIYRHYTTNKQPLCQWSN
jgi:hypothetical protein